MVDKGKEILVAGCGYGGFISSLLLMSDYSKTRMKSKLPIIAALATIAIGLPAKADDTRFTNRVRMIGAMTYATCRVRKGDITEEQAREISKKYANKYPELNAAYSWALSSDKATEAVQIMVTYMNAQCNDLTISEEEAQRLMKPYLE